MAKTVVSKSVQRRLAIQKAGKKPVKPVKKAKVKAKPKPFMNKKYVAPEPIESEQEAEFDEFDGHDVEDDFDNSADVYEQDELDEPEHEGA